MDLWDITKVMWRRWYVTVALLLLTAASATWIAVTTGPDYQATGYVGVVPPAQNRATEAGSRVNPWETDTLGLAARIRLESKRLADEMAEAGYLGEWGVEVTEPLPVLSIEVVAPSAEQALRTLHHLQDVVEQEVQRAQAEYDLDDGEMVTTIRLDQGESVEATRSALLRALVGVVGAELIFTVAVVLAFDALDRWRRSRQPRATSAATESGSGTVSGTGTGTGTGTDDATATNGADITISTGVTQSVGATGNAAGAAPDAGAGADPPPRRYGPSAGTADAAVPAGSHSAEARTR